MKLTVPRSDLREALQGLSRVIPNRTTLPVLHAVRIRADGNQVSITGTNLDEYATYRTGGTVEKPGVCIVDIDRLKPFAKGADQDLLTLVATKDRLTLTNPVHGQSIEHGIVVLDSEEWPADPPAIEAQPGGEEFLAKLHLITPFASTDPTRVVLNGVHLDVSEEGKHRLVATDGRRLTCFEVARLPIPESCTLRKCRFLEWSRLSGEARIGLHVKKDEVGWCKLETGGWSCTMRLTDGTYPNWRHVMPGGEALSTLIFDDADVALLKNALPTFPGGNEYNSPLCLIAKAGHLTVKGRNPDDKQWTTLDLPVSSAKGGDLEVGVNRQCLMEALEAGFRTFGAVDDQKPMWALDGNGGTHVLMPLRADTSAPVAAQVPAAVPVQKIETAPPVAEPQPVKEKTMPAKIVAEKSQEPGALDRLIAAFDAAKAKVREANEALAQVTGAIKDAIREDKQRRTEIDSVRAGLLKLQAIRV